MNSNLPPPPPKHPSIISNSPTRIPIPLNSSPSSSIRRTSLISTNGSPSNSPKLNSNSFNSTPPATTSTTINTNFNSNDNRSSSPRRDLNSTLLFSPSPIPSTSKIQIIESLPTPTPSPPPPPPSVILIPSESTTSSSRSINQPSPPSSYLEDLHEEEEELEHLAKTIAKVTQFNSSNDSFSSTFGTTLRRRITSTTTGTSKSNGKKVEIGEENIVIDLIEEENRKALEIMEDEEVARFLDRVGKQLTEVRATVPRSSIVMPEPTSYRTVDGKTDWFAFSSAYLRTLAYVHTPPTLLAPPLPTSFSVTSAKNHIERLYVITPLSFWENLLEGSLARIWRWENRERTSIYLAIYIFLWCFDLLPFFPPFAFLLVLLKPIFFPLSTEDLLIKSKLRKERRKEAIELTKQLEANSTKFGFAVQSAKGIFHGMRSSSESNISSSGEGGALMKGLSESLAVAGGIGAPSHINIQDSESNSSNTTTSTTSTSVPIKKEEVSIFKLLNQLRNVLGPSAQEFLGQSADISERMKNLIIYPDHPAVNGVCLRLILICLLLLLVPTWIQIKFTFAYIGLEFFFLWKLREDLPEWRRVLNPIYWLLLDAPTDSEYATYILRKRSLEKKPLRGALSKSKLNNVSPNLSRVNTNNSDIGISSATSGTVSTELNVDMLNIKRKRRLSSSSLKAEVSSFGQRFTNKIKSGSPSFSEEEILGSHFAILKAVPGTLCITSTRIKFAPTVVGLRTMSMKFGKLSGITTSSSSSSLLGGHGGGRDSDSNSIKSLSNEEGFLLDLALEDLDAIKKKSLFGFEGLEISEKIDGKVYSFSNVSRRDHAFNILLSNSNL